MFLGAFDRTHPPQRVVSLVPSMTESLFELGFGSSLVGVTDYCIHPEAGVAGLPRVGGPKNARVEVIQALKPDLVLANREENTREIVEGLAAAGLPVWLTFPKAVRESVDDLWELARIYHSKSAALQLRLLEDSLKLVELSQADQPARRYFCPIWQGLEADGMLWWMTFNRDTYSSDLLSICGGENVFAGRARQYPLAANWGRALPEEPGERDTRYPVVTADDVRAAMPDVILLPGEPFDFQPRHLEQMLSLFAGTPAVENRRVFRLDGTLITWYGTRLGRALSALPQTFS